MLAGTRSQPGSGCVILLHGLARSVRSMQVMERALRQAGYHTHNCGYPSRKHPIELLSETFIPRAIDFCESKYRPDSLHFVTHSMGGILLRCYLARGKPANLGRVVMLAPPNAGTELVDRLSRFQIFRLIFGSAATQLGADEANSLPKSLGAVDYDVGVIAGNRSSNPIASALIPGENDGTVSVRNTRLEGMSDFIVLPFGHTFFMNRPAVIAQTLHFLREGRFKR